MAETSNQRMRPGDLVAVVKFWREGDSIPEGWTHIGDFNAERVAGCPACKERASHETKDDR